MKYIAPESLATQFKNLGRFTAVTHGSFRIPGTCAVKDLDWNHMDQLHRNHIHHTYEHSVRLVTGKEFQFSLTKLKIAGIPLIVPVTDIRLGEGLFYQSYNIAGMIHVHGIVRSAADWSGGDWYIISNVLLKPLHWLLDRKLKRLNKVLHAEDAQIRDRRTAIRARGYRFTRDNPDYLTANDLTNNVIAPKLDRVYEASVAQATSDSLIKVSAGPVDLVVKRGGDGSLLVWPSVCPHEGAPLENGKACEQQITCPWHGLKFNAIVLSKASPKGKILDTLAVELNGDTLKVSST